MFSGLGLDAQATAERSLPSVSVLLPAWNEAQMIGRCLESLLAIHWPDLEIIVCAGGDDETLQIATRYAGEQVMVLEQMPGDGKQGALRHCLTRSRGEIIYLTDADCVVPATTFEAVIAPLVSGLSNAATGTCRPMPWQRDGFPLFQWAIERQVERERPAVSTGLLGRNCAIWRDAITAAGGFQESVPIGTDYHLAKLLLAGGERIRFVPEAVETVYPEAAGTFLHQRSRWLRNIFVHGRRFGDHAELIACTRTVALGTSFFLWPLTWPWTKAFGVVTWLLALLGLTGLRWRYARALASETGVPLTTRFLIQLPRFTVLDIASWAWPLIDSASRARRLRW